MSEGIQERITNVRNMPTDDIHNLFISPKQRIMMLLDYLEKGGDLRVMAGKIHRKKGEKVFDKKGDAKQNESVETPNVFWHY